MKKINSIIVMFLLIFSLCSANSITNNNSPIDYIDMSDESECWDLAVSTYQIFDDVGRDREYCIEMGVWAYNSCMEELEDGFGI